MSTIKHLILTGISEVSWDDAITTTIKDASKTIDNISGVSIVSKSANISNNQITEYIVDLDLSFIVNVEE